MIPTQRAAYGERIMHVLADHQLEAMIFIRLYLGYKLGQTAF